MDQRVSLLTLGVSNLEHSVGFYGRLGWTPGNDWRAQDVAFFQTGGMVLALWDADELAQDSGTQANPPGAVTLAYNTRTREEVDEVLALAERAGASIRRSGAETPWGGYSGCFHDPDGHPWEVAHNPAWTIADDGSVTLS